MNKSIHTRKLLGKLPNRVEATLEEAPLASCSFKMISFLNINKQYGKQLLFVDASFQLNPGDAACATFVRSTPPVVDAVVVPAPSTSLRAGSSQSTRRMGHPPIRANGAP
jgi:hypothetical protein